MPKVKSAFFHFIRQVDSPTQRYGRHVEGAGVHHNPTAGPADGEWMYGHNWVSLCFPATHSLWGLIALPMRSLLLGVKMVVNDRLMSFHH